MTPLGGVGIGGQRERGATSAVRDGKFGGTSRPAREHRVAGRLTANPPIVRAGPGSVVSVGISAAAVHVAIIVTPPDVYATELLPPHVDGREERRGAHRSRDRDRGRPCSPGLLARKDDAAAVRVVPPGGDGVAECPYCDFRTAVGIDRRRRDRGRPLPTRGSGARCKREAEKRDGCEKRRLDDGQTTHAQDASRDYPPISTHVRRMCLGFGRRRNVRQGGFREVAR